MTREDEPYPDLVGNGFVSQPRMIVRWNGLEFGYTVKPGCFLWLRVQHERGLWPVIDSMLEKIGITDEAERAQWYRDHADDVVSMESFEAGSRSRNGHLNEKTVYRWTDCGRKRPLEERLVPALQELEQRRKELHADMLPEAHRGRKH